MSSGAVGSGPRRRSVLALGGAAAIVGASAALAGCGKPGGARPDATTRPRESTDASGRPRLEQWYHPYGEAGTQAAAERYAAAYPAADVRVTWKGDDYVSAIGAALGTPAGPDVFEYGNGPTIDMITAGLVADLTELVDTSVVDFQPSLIGRMSHDGKLYAIPQNVDIQLLVYRPSLLARRGLTPPTTMDELIETATALSSGDTKGLFVGNDGGADILGGPTLWSAGLDYLTDDNAFGFAGARAATAFSRLRELRQSGALLLDSTTGWADATAIVSGRAAMQFTGLWTFPALQKGLGTDFAVLPWPALDGQATPSVPVGAFGACVSAHSVNVEAAKEFVKWLWVDQMTKQLEFATDFGFHIPARTGLIDQAQTLKSGAGAEAAAIALDYGHAQTPMLWTPKCAAAFSTMMKRVIDEGADPTVEIGAVRTVAEAELARVRAR